MREKIKSLVYNGPTFMTTEEFEKLVNNALEDLPDYFKQKLDNVAVVCEMWPKPEDAKGRLLLGLYQGIPKPKRGANYTMVLPDKISIFQGPIELVSRGDEQMIKNLVVDTVRHEIAHHFGITDARINEIQNRQS